MSTTNKLTLEQINDISNAATALASVDHYLRHGTVADRKMAAEARTSQVALEKIIGRDLLSRTMSA